MKISYNWLKEYVDIKMEPDMLASLLSMSGLAVESIHPSAGDYILELEITANRPDWLSVIGVAREVAAVTGAKLKLPAVKGVMSAVGGQQSAVSIKIEDKQLCPRYTARIIRNVKVGESPLWLKSRLEAIGLRPVNNIADITNLCLFETGEPMHAFDLHKLEGPEIVVRRAKKEEKIITIDGTERKLDDTVLVIADRIRPVAIAGIMGGLATEVTGSTKDVLLEAAYFDPVSIRRTSRKLALKTESSYRFERRVDVENIIYSSDRALELILLISGGEAGEFVDLKEKPDQKKIIDLRFERCRRLLGVEIGPETIKRTVESLGLTVIGSQEKGLKLEAPAFRYDLIEEIDVIEEVARIFGYDNIPETIPNITGRAKRQSLDLEVTGLVRSSVAGMGYDEIITYSLMNKRSAMLARVDLDGNIEIKNPITSEQEAMRQSLIPGMLNSIIWNVNRKTKDLKLFEIGNIYFKEKGEYREDKHLSIAIAGKSCVDWLSMPGETPFFELKGIVEALFSELGIVDYSFKSEKVPGFTSSASCSVRVASKEAGLIGEVSGKILRDYDIKERVFYCEISLEPVYKLSVLNKKFKELPRYPSVMRDISIVADSGVANEDLILAMRRSGGGVLKEVKLIDRYAGRQIPESKVGLTYRLEYQDPRKTLEEKDVQDAHAKILRELEAKYGAKLR